MAAAGAPAIMITVDTDDSGLQDSTTLPPDIAKTRTPQYLLPPSHYFDDSLNKRRSSTPAMLFLTPSIGTGANRPRQPSAVTPGVGSFGSFSSFPLTSDGERSRKKSSADADVSHRRACRDSITIASTPSLFPPKTIQGRHLASLQVHKQDDAISSVSPIVRVKIPELEVTSADHLSTSQRGVSTCSIAAVAGSPGEASPTRVHDQAMLSVQDVYGTDSECSKYDESGLGNTSNVIRRVHIVTCKCGRNIHVKCTNTSTKVEEEQTSAGPAAHYQTINIAAPKSGHKFKPIKEVIDEMKKAPNDASIQLDTCKDLGYYANESMIEVLVARDAAIGCLIDAIKTFPDDQDIKKEAVLSLLKFADSSTANCVTIAKNGWKVLFAVIKHEESDQSLIATSCKTLVHVINGSEESPTLPAADIEAILELANRFPDSADIHSHVCDIMVSAVHGGKSKDVSTVLVSSRTIETIVAALMEYADNSQLQESGLWALACLTQTSHAACFRMYEHDGLGHVTHIMEEYEQDEDTQEYCAWILANFAAIESLLPKLFDEQVIQLLIAAMGHHDDNIELHSQVAFVVGQAAAESDDVKHQFVEKGGMEYLVLGMANFPECVKFLENAIRAIGNIAMAEQCRRLLPQEGGVTAVIDAMLHLEVNETVQQYGCGALANVAFNVNNNKIYIVNNGGVLAVVNCLRHFLIRRDLVVVALGALANISGHDATNLRMVEGDCIPHIMAALNSYSCDDTIVHLCCSVLAELVCVSGIPDETLIEIAEAVMEIHDTTAGEDDVITEQLAVATATLLENLKYSGSVGLMVFDHVDGLTVLLKLMKRYSHLVEIQESGCKLITMLAMEGHPGTPVMADVIYHVIENFKQNELLQLLAWGALSYLSSSQENFYQSKLMPYVLEILDYHQRNEKIQAIILLSLRNRVMKGLEDLPPTIINKVIRAMKSFPENGEMQAYGCELLDSMTTTETGKGALKTIDAVSFIEGTMKRFDKLQQIQDRGSHLIQALQHDDVRE